MRIDARAHLGRFGEQVYAVDPLADYQRRCGLDGLIVSNLDAAAAGAGAADADEPIANGDCLDFCAKQRGWHALYWVRPGRVDHSPHAMAGALLSEPFAGLLLAPELNGFSLESPALEPVLTVAASVKKPVFIRVGERPGARPIDAYVFSRRVPQTAFVLLGTDGLALWSEAIEAVTRAKSRGDARLYVETSGASCAEISSTVEMVGPERLLFGSNACRNAEEHARNVRALWDDLGNALPPPVVRKILGENAAVLLGLMSG